MLRYKQLCLNMDKKSKSSSSSSKRKEWSKSPKFDESKTKRSKHLSSSAKREKSKETKKSTQRKSRWQAAEAEATNSSKSVTTPVSEIKKENPVLPPKIYPNMKDLLPNKETLVDVLFELVKDESLEKITPDYLKNYSKEALKKLCHEELKKLSDDVILQLAYSQEQLSIKDEKETVETKQNLCVKLDKSNSSKGKDEEKSQILESKSAEGSPAETNDSLSSDVLELHTTTTEIESMVNEESEIPVVIKDEVAKDLILPERDAELLELEMRARAIRSLLKAKNQIANNGDGTVGEK